MSFIYEALKRAEDENARGVPTPRVVRRGAFFVTQPRWWVWALVGVLGVNALVVAFLLVRGSDSSDVKVATAPVAPPVVAPARAPETVNETPPAPAVVAPSPPPPPPPVVAPAIKPTPRAPQPTAAPLATPPATPPRTPPAPRPAVVAPTPAPSAPQVTTPISPPTPAPATAPPPAPAAPPPADTPKLQVQVVLYSEVPAERLVFIDGRRYAEGDKVDADTVVERITPQGAVVVRNGRSFTLTSGSR
ncbi:MAG TPA: general secretion pathway protein GspB [Solirubrobacteraceae bacterium]